jgi:TRAP-type C4-dicarboxylate transport system permease small subunit
MAETVPGANVTKRAVPIAVRIVGHLLRAVFLLALIVVAIRVSAPQNETVWSAYETPGDLIRLILGAAVAIGILVQLFRPPKDAQAYRTWALLGIFLAPLAVAVAVMPW